jgi:hypothetical protein
MCISAVFRSRSRGRIGNLEKNQGIPFSGILCIFSVAIVGTLQVFRFLRSMMIED